MLGNKCVGGKPLGVQQGEVHVCMAQGVQDGAGRAARRWWDGMGFWLLRWLQAGAKTSVKVQLNCGIKSCFLLALPLTAGTLLLPQHSSCLFPFRMLAPEHGARMVWGILGPSGCVPTGHSCDQGRSKLRSLAQ